MWTAKYRQGHGQFAMGSEKMKKNKQPASRKPKPSGKRGPRKAKIVPERLRAMLASEARLVCRQYRQLALGRFERCTAPATGYGYGGDSCDDHRQKLVIRYATTRQPAVEKAA